MSGAVPQLPLYTFMAWIGRIFPFNCNFIEQRPDRLLAGYPSIKLDGDRCNLT